MANNYEPIVDALGTSLGFDGEVYGEFSVSINKNLNVSFEVSDSFEFKDDELAGVMLHPCGDLRILILNNYARKILHFCVLDTKDISAARMVMLVTDFDKGLFKLIKKVWVMTSEKEGWIATDICKFKESLPRHIK